MGQASNVLQETIKMTKLAAFAGLGLMFVSGASSAAVVKVHLGFATYDPDQSCSAPSNTTPAQR
jgi:hypothetical protein